MLICPGSTQFLVHETLYFQAKICYALKHSLTLKIFFSIKNRSSRKAWLLTTALVILSPPQKRGKKKSRMNSKNRDQKSRLSAWSNYAGQILYRGVRFIVYPHWEIAERNSNNTELKPISPWKHNFNNSFSDWTNKGIVALSIMFMKGRDYLHEGCKDYWLVISKEILHSN